jgi:hypothetical protein
MYLPVDKAEEALVIITTPAATPLGLTVLPGRSSGVKTPPLLTCAAEADGEFDPPNSGNGWLTCTLQIRQRGVQNPDGTDPNAAAPEIQAKVIASAIWVVVMVDTLAALMTAAVADFTVFPAGVFFGTPERFQDEEGLWIDELKFRIYCCGKALAP